IPHFEVRKNTQAISLGATILTSSEFDASDRKYPKLTGIEVGYKFYPTITRHKVDFYLHASILLQRIVDRWEVNYWNTTYSFYQNSDYRNVETIVNPTLGYGVSFSLLKRFKLTQSIGACYFFSGVDGGSF